MLWKQAVRDPHLILLKDLIERQYGEKEMAKLKQQGFSKTDLARWHMQADFNTEPYKLTMVKDPNNEWQAFVQLWVSNTPNHAICLMSNCTAQEVDMKKKHEQHAPNDIRPGGQKEGSDIREFTAKPTRRWKMGTSLECMFKWNVSSKKNKNHHHEQKKRQPVKKETYTEEITPAVTRLLKRTCSTKEKKQKKECKVPKGDIESVNWQEPRFAPSETTRARKVRPGGRPTLGKKDEASAGLRGGATDQEKVSQ
jgi:hypothetical protein